MLLAVFLAAVSLDVETGNPLHLVRTAEEKPVVVLRNGTGAEATFPGGIRLSDYFLRHEFTVPAGPLAAGELRRIPLPSPMPAKGLWTASAVVDSVTQTVCFAVLDRHVRTPILEKPAFRMGVHWHAANFPRDRWPVLIDALVSCGAKLSRASGLHWSMVQPKSADEFDWTRPDALVRDLRSAGISVHCNFIRAPRWSQKKEELERIGEDDFNAYAVPPREGLLRDYAEAVAARYGTRIDYYECGNEWDLIPSAVFSADEALRMQREACEGLKAGCAGATVMLNGWGFGATEASGGIVNPGMIEHFAEHAHGLYDVWPVHGHGSLENFVFRASDPLRRLRERHGIRTPWTAGETAFSSAGVPPSSKETSEAAETGNERAAARAVWQKILYCWANGSADYIWYNLIACGPTAYERGFGMMSRDLYPRASYAAFSALAGILKGGSFDRKLTETYRRHVYSFRSPDGDGLTVAGWDMCASAPVPLTVVTDARRAEAVDLMGNRRELPVVGGEVEWSLSVTPEALVLAGARTAELKLSRFSGRIGAKASRFLGDRVFSEDAECGKYWNETTEAFLTHYDDGRQKGKGFWQGEYWGKSVLSMVASAEQTGDTVLLSRVKEHTLGFLKEFQRPDGYLSSYRDRHFLGGPDGKGAEVFCWNVWGQKYTMWALLELNRVCPDRRLLASARAMMDRLMSTLEEDGRRIEDTGYFVGMPSMSILKPLMILYRETGDGKYLGFARDIARAWDRKGNPAPNLIANAFGGKPVHAWYPRPERWAKAYEMMSCLEGLVDLSRATGEKKLLDAVRRVVAKLRKDELNAVGSVGFFDHFTGAAHCVNATTEPCDVIHWIRVNRDLFLETDDPGYLENVEFAFHNAFLAGVYREGTWGAHSVRSHGTRHRTAPHQVGMKYHQCCIDNMPRTFADVAGIAVSETSDRVLSVNLYAPVATVCNGNGVRITGDYPVGDGASVRIAAKREGKVRFRRPKSFDSMAVNGVRVDGEWFVAALPRGESVFELSFARTPKIVRADAEAEADPRSDGFETVYETPEMKGRARVKRGVRVLYGPLILAKSRYAGTAERDIFTDRIGTGAGWSVSAERRENALVHGAWRLTFRNGESVFACDVCDFASAADSSADASHFSIWF